MIQFEKLGIFISKPVALILVAIYLLQSGVVAFLLNDKYQLHRQIEHLQGIVNDQEERLKILNAIEGIQIGFSDQEVGTLANVVYTEGKRYGLDPLFVLAVIMTESTFRKGQVSEKGAMGLMQVIPSTGESVAERVGIEWYGPPTLHDHESNIKLGTRYLFEKIMEFKDVKKALAAYNMGTTRLRNFMQANENRVPRQYFERVLANYHELKENYAS